MSIIGICWVRNKMFKGLKFFLAKLGLYTFTRDTYRYFLGNEM